MTTTNGLALTNRRPRNPKNKGSSIFSLINNFHPSPLRSSSLFSLFALYTHALAPSNFNLQLLLLTSPLSLLSALVSVMCAAFFLPELNERRHVTTRK